MHSLRESPEASPVASELCPARDLKQSGIPILTWLLLVLILSAGVFFRFTNLDKKVYWHDEAMTSLRLTGQRYAALVDDVFDGRELGIDDLQKYQRPGPNTNAIDTLTAIATDDPKHPPLYYAMGRLWLEVFGPSVRSVRGFAALLSLLVFPALYWLCRELFSSVNVALVAVALVAISPFHLLYAQESYQYGLWTVTVLAAAAALFRAMRLQSLNGWALYAVMVALALYTHSLSTLVIFGHALYVGAVSLQKVKEKKSQLAKLPLAYLLATVSGVALFFPWGLVIFRSMRRKPAGIGFLDKPLPLEELLRGWGRHFLYLFLDTGPEPYGIDGTFVRFASISVAVLIIYAVYVLWRSNPANQRWFVLILTGTAFISLAMADLVLGGRRSAIPRYLIPSFLGIQILVAHLIAVRVQSKHLLQRRIWQGVFALLVVSGIISCVFVLRADTWWNKYQGATTLKIATVINQTSRPLIISDEFDANGGNLLALSYRVKPEVRFRLFASNQGQLVEEANREMFLFNPSPKLKAMFAEKYTMEPVENQLWRLTQPKLGSPSQRTDDNSPAVHWWDKRGGGRI